jgi:hypothetical protein
VGVRGSWGGTGGMLWLFVGLRVCAGGGCVLLYGCPSCLLGNIWVVRGVPCGLEGLIAEFLGYVLLHQAGNLKYDMVPVTLKGQFNLNQVSIV